MGSYAVVSNRASQVLNQETSLAQGRNTTRAQFDPNQIRRVERPVYIYTVGKLSYTRLSVPDVFPQTIIPACGEGERYRKVIQLSDPMPTAPRVDPDDPVNGAPKIYSLDGRRVAADFCNPANITLNQDFEAKGGAEQWVRTGTGDGQNLNQRGVFWSLNDPPKEEEIAAAEKRLNKYFRQILLNIDQIPDTDAMKQGMITPDHHAACDHFGEERPWHREFVQKSVCPNCGVKVNKGVAFHRDNGVMCVINWRAAVACGAVKKDDVPEDARWEGFEKRGPGRPPKEAGA